MMESCDYFKEIASCFLKFRETDFLCDTVLVADDKELKAHSLLLAAASPLFKTTFESSGEPGLHYIKLPGYNSTIVEIALNVIYTGDLVLPDQFADGRSLLELFSSLQNLGLRLNCVSDCETAECKADLSLEAFNQTTTTSAAELIDSHNEQECFKSDPDDVSQIETNRIDFECVDHQLHHHAQFDSGNLRKMPNDALTSTLSLTSVGQRICVKQELEELVDKRLKLYSQGLNHNESTAEKCESHEIEKGSTEPYEHSPTLQDPDDEWPENQEVISASCRSDFESASCEIEPGNDDDESGQKKPFPCLQCNKTFTHPTYLEVHSRIHTGEKPFVCNYCGRRFSQRANLNRHTLGHLGEKPNLCHICGKGFIQKTQLDDHLVQHSNKLPYACRLCPHSFKDRLTLRQHVLHHHPENHSRSPGAEASVKVNVCETCGKSYSTIGGLRMHARIHTGQVVPCPTCHKAFVNRALMLQHTKGHTKEKSYECTTCGKAFVYKNALTVHTRVHTGEKPYRCTVCGNCYAQFGHLQSHKKTHTGEKPFTCSSCGKSYRQKVDLRLHTNRVHRDLAMAKPEQSSAVQC